ncbi:MAG TPA: hypothetical protein VN205_01625 [Thermomonas sp.]|nr:hypothetical protein [Thermomonas sp.]
MKPNRLHIAMLAAMLGSAALVGCKKKEEPAPLPPVADTTAAPMPAPAPMSPTASVNGVDLGNAVGADMRVTAPMSSFGTKDTIYAAVSTGTSDPAASVAGKLGAKWSYIGADGTVTVVNDESKDLTLAGDGVTNFQISKPDGWPTGKYKLEVMLDGAVVQTREFEVK